VGSNQSCPGARGEGRSIPGKSLLSFELVSDRAAASSWRQGGHRAPRSAVPPTGEPTAQPASAALDRNRLRALEQYDWPGNVREPAHVLECAVILTNRRRLRLDQALTLVRPRLGHDASVPVPGSRSALLTDAEVRRLERENIQRAIARTSLIRQLRVQ
jgi:hypothetical protein